MRHSRLRRIVLFAAVALLATRTASVSAVEAEWPALKAAFLLNFAKFAEWPSDRPSGQFRICVVGDHDVADALRALVVRSARRDGVLLSIAELKAAAARDATELRACQVLYVAGSERRIAEAVGTLVGDAPVFTVSDLEGFTRAGGVAQFYLENDRMRFEINIQNAQRARLKLGSPLINLARITRGLRP